VSEQLNLRSMWVNQKRDCVNCTRKARQKKKALRGY